MLHYQMKDANSFIGEQIFKDGKFHRVTGRFLPDGSIFMKGIEPSITTGWVMKPVADINSPESSTNSTPTAVDR